MKFFTTGAKKSNVPLYTAFGFFLFFILIFWISGFVYFGSKYGFTAESVADFYFGPAEFPNYISTAQLAEDIHINLFLTAVLLLAVSGFLLQSNISYRLKLYLILLIFLSALADSLIGFYIINAGRESAILKVIFFVLFQFFLIVGIITILLNYFKGKLSKSKDTAKYYNKVILFFSIITFVMVGVNFYLFNEKLGFSTGLVSTYYLGDEEKFVNPKTLTGLLETAVPHFAAIGLFLVALTHFITFTHFRFKIFLIISLFAAAFSDVVSGFLILFIHPSFSVFKLIVFFIFQAMLFCSALVLLISSLKGNILKSARVIQ